MKTFVILLASAFILVKSEGPKKEELEEQFKALFGENGVLPDYMFKNEEDAKTYVAKHGNPVINNPPPPPPHKEKTLDSVEEILMTALMDYKKGRHTKKIEAAANVLKVMVYGTPNENGHGSKGDTHSSQKKRENEVEEDNPNIKRDQLSNMGSALYDALSSFIEAAYKPEEPAPAPEKRKIKYHTPKRVKRSVEAEPVSVEPTTEVLFSYNAGTESDATGTIIICSKEIKMLNYGDTVYPPYAIAESCKTEDSALGGEANCYQKIVETMVYETNDKWETCELKTASIDSGCECECLQNGLCHMMASF